MAQQTKIRGDDRSNLEAATPAARELGVNTDTHGIRVGDGSTLGGFRLGDVDHRQETADYTAVKADKSVLIEMNKATAVTLNLTAAATLSEGWFCAVYNSGAGTLTIDPNAAEQINGTSTITLATGQSCLVVCDGAAFWTVGLGGGARETLESQEVTSAVAAVDLTTGIGATYDAYEIEVVGVAPASDDVELWMRASDDGGATFEAAATDYEWRNMDTADSGGTILGDKGSSADSKMSVSGISSAAGVDMGNATDENGRFTIQFAPNYPSNSARKLFSWQGSFVRAGNGQGVPIVGFGAFIGNTNDIDAIRFLFESGNIAAGRFTLYGIKH